MYMKSSFLKRLKQTGSAAGLGLGMLSLAACSDTPDQVTAQPPSQPTSTPNGQACAEMDWNDDLQLWECDEDDDSHSHGGFFYYGGSWHHHKNVSNLKSSSSYKSYAKSPSFKSGA